MYGSEFKGTKARTNADTMRYPIANKASGRWVIYTLAVPGVRECVLVVVAGVVCALVVVDEGVSALGGVIADSKLESLLESKSALVGVSHLGGPLVVVMA